MSPSLSGRQVWLAPSLSGEGWLGNFAYGRTYPLRPGFSFEKRKKNRFASSSQFPPASRPATPRRHRLVSRLPLPPSPPLQHYHILPPAFHTSTPPPLCIYKQSQTKITRPGSFPVTPPPPPPRPSHSHPAKANQSRARRSRGGAQDRTSSQRRRGRAQARTTDPTTRRRRPPEEELAKLGTEDASGRGARAAPPRALPRRHRVVVGVVSGRGGVSPPPLRARAPTRGGRGGRGRGGPRDGGAHPARGEAARRRAAVVDGDVAVQVCCPSSLLCFHLPSPVFHAFVGDSGGRYVSSELVAAPNQNQAIGGQEQERLLNASIFSCTPRCRSRITLSILCFAEEENHSVLTEI